MRGDGDEIFLVPPSRMHNRSGRRAGGQLPSSWRHGRT
nr:MAG TPA: hypothetical protein [Caudoviricetes sp.]